jgi:hypothetical protein
VAPRQFKGDQPPSPLGAGNRFGDRRAPRAHLSPPHHCRSCCIGNWRGRQAPLPPPGCVRVDRRRCERGDSNPHGLTPLDPKSSASANSATLAGLSGQGLTSIGRRVPLPSGSFQAKTELNVAPSSEFYRAVRGVPTRPIAQWAPLTACLTSGGTKSSKRPGRSPFTWAPGNHHLQQQWKAEGGECDRRALARLESAGGGPSRLAALPQQEAEAAHASRATFRYVFRRGGICFIVRSCPCTE